MNANKKGDDIIDAILKDAHREIEPPDSWEALRTRINHRINSGKPSSQLFAQKDRSVVFWRRMTLAMAACLLLVAGVLIHTIGFIQRGEKASRQRVAAANRGLFSQVQLNQLMKTFSNVRELFGQQSPWIMVGSGSNAEIGIDEMVRMSDTSKVVVIRLALDSENQGAGRRYFDIVTFSNQQVNCQLPMADASAINVSLRPMPKEHGTVALEINAQVNGNSAAKSITTVVNDAFTSLVRLRANGYWVDIDAIAQPIPIFDGG